MAARTQGQITLGIDLGGTKILAGVVDGAGRIVGRGKLKTPFESDAGDAHGGARRGLRPRAEGGRRLAGARRARSRSRRPAPWTRRRASLLRAGNLAVKNWNDRQGPARARSRRPAGASRTTSASRRSARRGSAPAAARATMVAVWVGTGVGGAVIMDGKIHTGRNRNAGEIGQIQIDFRRAEPGKLDGTLEGIAAKVGITAWLRRRIAEGREDLPREGRVEEGRAAQGLPAPRGRRGEGRARAPRRRPLREGRRDSRWRTSSTSSRPTSSSSAAAWRWTSARRISRTSGNGRTRSRSRRSSGGSGSSRPRWATTRAFSGPRCTRDE